LQQVPTDPLKGVTFVRRPAAEQEEVTSALAVLWPQLLARYFRGGVPTW